MSNFENLQDETTTINTIEKNANNDDIIDLNDIYIDVKEKDIEEDNDIINLIDVYQKPPSDQKKTINIKLDGKNNFKINKKKINDILYELVKKMFYDRIFENMDGLIEKILIQEIEDMQKLFLEIDK